MAAIKPLNAGVVSRLRLIDFLLEQYGSFQRASIEDFFGISTPQASLDIKKYVELAPQNLVYSTSRRCYEKTDAFKRKFP